MATRSMHRVHAVFGRSLPALGLLLASCAHSGAKPAQAPEGEEEVEARRVVLLGETAEPAFFLSAEADAPAIAFGGVGAKLILRGPSSQGRTPVRVHGRVTLEAYVPDELLELRAQRALVLPKTQVFLASGDTLRILGPGGAENHVKVAANVQVGASVLGPFTSELPLEALAANTPPSPTAAEALEPGILYSLPAETAMPLFDEPHGALVALLPAQTFSLLVAVLAVEPTGFRVRLGQGPYLTAFTSAPLVLLGSASRTDPEPTAPSRGLLPARIKQTPGRLMRIANGTKLSFRGVLVATFRSEGFARILQENGKSVEVLAAADDHVAVRGVADAESLFAVDDPELLSGDAESQVGASELGSALP